MFKSENIEDTSGEKIVNINCSNVNELGNRETKKDSKNVPMRKSKNNYKQRLIEAIKKREDAMNDPNNPLYALRSNYYRNNYSALNGVDQELFKLRRFPLFKLIKEMQEEEQPMSRHVEKGGEK